MDNILSFSHRVSAMAGDSQKFRLKFPIPEDVAAFMGGLRYEFLSNTYLTGRANVLFTNFISRSVFFNNPDLISGYALTFGYNFALGPLEVSAMYSDRLRKVTSYVSLGISF